MCLIHQQRSNWTKHCLIAFRGGASGSCSQLNLPVDQLLGCVMQGKGDECRLYLRRLYTRLHSLKTAPCLLFQLWQCLWHISDSAASRMAVAKDPSQLPNTAVACAMLAALKPASPPKPCAVLSSAGHVVLLAQHPCTFTSIRHGMIDALLPR